MSINWLIVGAQALTAIILVRMFESLFYRTVLRAGLRTAVFRRTVEEMQAERFRVVKVECAAAAELNAGRHEALRDEELSMHQAIAGRTQQEVFAAARRVLTNLAGTKIEDNIVGFFVGGLSALDEKEKQLLVAALEASSRVRSR